MINNTAFSVLCDLGVCASDQIEPFFHRTRDREDIPVFRCKRSGVLFLARSDHMSLAHYDAKAPTHRHGEQHRAMVSTNDDSLRRKTSFANLIRGKHWLDVGAGSGAVLDAISAVALAASAVEPQEQAAATLQALGYNVYRRMEHVPEGGYDVVSFFHVLEHLEHPLTLLKQAFETLKPGGHLILEVPHAKDFLIHFAQNEAFKNHTFWSEHLVLHTRDSLQALASAAGFANIVVQGVQRYPLANHLRWLIEGQPGGQVQWGFLTDATLDGAYASVLSRLDMTDTLTLTAVKPALP